MSTPKPTESAMKCAKELFGSDLKGCDMVLANVAATIDRVCGLPFLTTIALAAQGVIDAGRPHSGSPTPGYPDGCSCENCESFDLLKSAVDGLTKV